MGDMQCCHNHASVTTRLHYRTGLERFSENDYGSIENSPVPHLQQETGSDRSEPSHSVNACGLVLINNHKISREHAYY